MTAYGTIEVAVQAMKQGAFDFVPKPVDISHLFLLVERGMAGLRQHDQPGARDQRPVGLAKGRRHQPVLRAPDQ